MQFNSLARYAPSEVAKMSDPVHRIVGGLGPHLINKCTKAFLNSIMDIALNSAYTQYLEDHKMLQWATREHDQG